MPGKDILFVAVQFALFGVYVLYFPSFDFDAPEWLRVAGFLLAGAGVAVTAWAILLLNTRLSPFPTPKTAATLIQSGVYKFIRHPIYTGLLFGAFGFAFYTANVLRLAIFFALLLLFWQKARYEERLLADKYPDYESYKTKAGMFLPRWKQLI